MVSPPVSPPVPDPVPAPVPAGPSAPRPGGLRIALAFLVAAGSDLVGALLTPFPPAVLAIDLATAGGLWLLLGRPGFLLAALVFEAIPGFGALPFWTLVVLAIAVTGRLPGRGDPPASPG